MYSDEDLLNQLLMLLVTDLTALLTFFTTVETARETVAFAALNPLLTLLLIELTVLLTLLESDEAARVAAVTPLLTYSPTVFIVLTAPIAQVEVPCC